tara:strand:+ start:1264 stop:2421 length:1158 start_codon:yes stop_codon:yes gene_type:complete
MKILHCCLAAFYIDKYGYQENVLPKMHKIQGHEVEILASTENYLNGNKLSYVKPSVYYNEDKIKVTRLPYLNIFPHFIARKLRMYHGVYNKLNEFKPDIIWLHDVQFLDIFQVIKYLKNNKNTIVFADGHADFTNSATNWISKNVLHRIIYKFCAQKIDKYVTKFYGTLPCRVDFFKKFYKVDNSKVELLVMGVDDTLIEYDKEKLNSDLRRKHQIDNNDFLLISGGKINHKKNIHHLVNAVTKINQSDIKLILFGKPDEKILNIIGDKLDHPSIIYLGWINNIDIHKYLLISDLAIFPGKHSVLWEQSVGCGTPGIFKKISGHEHINIGGNCIMIDNGSEKEITDAIIKVYNDKDLYNSIKKVSLEKGSDHFSYYKIAERSIKA